MTRKKGDLVFIRIDKPRRREEIAANGKIGVIIGFDIYASAHVLFRDEEEEEVITLYPNEMLDPTESELNSYFEGRNYQ